MNYINGTNGTVIGQPAGYAAQYNAEASNNICCGRNAGHFLTSGSGNILLGAGAGAYLTTENNRLVIKTPEFLIETEMSGEEVKVLHAVFSRAVKELKKGE